MIAPNVVLTAAHCGERGDEFVGQDALVGAYRYQQETDGAGFISINAQRNHPDYDSASFANDFALLRLSQPVNLDSTTFLSISDDSGSNSPSDGTPLTVIGLGATSEGGPGSNILLEVDVDVVDLGTCNQSYGNVNGEVMFCAGKFILSVLRVHESHSNFHDDSISSQRWSK